MRKTIFLAFLLLAAATFTGCNKESDPDIRDSFVATYSVTETWTENGKTVTKPAFSMSIEKSSQDANTVLLNNFANYGAGIIAEATVSGNNLILPQQTLSNLKAITGTGTLTEPTLTFTYTESYNSVSINITATAKKK
ncbi:MAG: hypothetical protein NT144_12505 [Bacteroidia bacterium]|nr:hypothetical protein [Bacteroidia bacterium]